MVKLICLLCSYFMLNSIPAQVSDTLKVHFLYGSKPVKDYKKVEPKWFGGKLGGHVGIEGDSNRILNFILYGDFHIYAKSHNRNSRFTVHSEEDFYSLFGSHPDSVKKTIIHIPVTPMQKQTFDSISQTYLQQTPYDYAFFGMRCGAAAYEILAQIGILPAYAHHRTYRKIFYPKKLRKRLIKLANQNQWTVTVQEGSERRKWERD